ncbi:MAG TPA: pseudouridine synthase [Acidimicrobiia bacterium]|jgi:23S rRNA pseudouridine2605 synthase|nr:pseudouridine synthase [Acidimicrobiia bacterium]
MAERIRIQRAIAGAGLMSRRSAEEAILAGRVRRNGEPVVLGDRVDPETDLLTLDGVPVPISEDLETHLLYKPVGAISTARDPQGRATVVDLVASDKRLYPVGRLDADSEGLILVSNDGELTHRVTHPSFGVTKTYLAEVEGKVDRGLPRRLTEGVTLEDGLARASEARIVDTAPDRSLVEVVMVEGRKREVRRMMEHVGHPVLRLVRTAIGGLTAPDLAPGESRRLTASDIRRIFEAT